MSNDNITNITDAPKPDTEESEPEIPPELRDLLERAKEGNLTMEEQLRLSDAATGVASAALQRVLNLITILRANALAQADVGEDDTPDIQTVSESEARNSGLEL